MLTIREKIGYGLGDTASNIVFQVVVNFMMIFYTDVFGIEAAAVGTLMLVVRLFDAFTDPVMGGIADRTNSKMGRYRPYLIYASIPYAVLAVLAFTTPDFSESSKLIYAYITYALLMTVYTAVNIPYSALGGVITDNVNERASVQSYRFAMAMVGGLIVTSSTMVLVNYFGDVVYLDGVKISGDMEKGFQYAMGTMAALAMLCFILCFYNTRERVTPPPTEKKTAIWQDMMELTKNSQFMLIAAMAFFLLALVAMRGASAPYYVEYYLQRPDLIGTFLTIGMGAAFVGAVATNFLSAKMCNLKLLKIGYMGIIAFHVVLYFLPASQLELIFVFFILANFAHMIVVPLMFSMVADTADYGALKTGKKTMGMAFSFHLLMIKLGLAVGGAITGWLLSYYGYVANQAQTETALQGILVIFALSSAICGVGVAIAMHFYKLTDEKMHEIHKQLKERDAEPESEPDANPATA